MPVLPLGDYIRSPQDPDLARTPYGELADRDLAQFLAHWPDLHADALKRTRHRIHPTARIHPYALVGDDVIVGPHAQVWEFSTVRGHTVIGPGAGIGFNCEVTNAYVGQGSVLGHRIGINRTLIGAEAHLSALVTVAAIHLSQDMRHPDREVILRLPDGLYRCGTPQFGALIGDHVQTGNNISLGPGVALGRGCKLNSGVTLGPARVVPANNIVALAAAPDTRARLRAGRPAR
ncbi:transferase [Streptomyces antnestii]|uniref:Transferase n=1 Tax=Streptomyces antnestii TaxID=2494256 RepID=A0A437NZW1_9ACTN|nr:transferase [Streptomyces sp. San01]RVU15552.1 transferase [Streptomyces sp. San01]